MLSALILTERGYPAVQLAPQPVNQRFVQPGPLVLRLAPLKYPTPTTDRDRTVSRRSEPSSRTTLIGGQPNPWAVKDALEAYKSDNSTVLSWIEDADLDLDYFLDRPRDQTYSEFADWCKLSGIKSTMVTGKKTFFKEVVAKYDLEEKPRQKADGKRYFMVKI